MKIYDLYLESGPRRRKTMVHILDLLGCTIQGSTTEEALESAPAAIRVYLGFLQRHGAPVDPEESFSTAIAEHITQGNWLGHGDPAPGFKPDFQTLTRTNLNLYLRWLAWMREDLTSLVDSIPMPHWDLAPDGGGRSIRQILEHTAESQTVYLRYQVGKVEGLSEALRAAQAAAPDQFLIALSRLWQISSARLEQFTDAELEQIVQHGQVTWTTHRALRRTMEHEWEHLVEIRDRFR